MGCAMQVLQAIGVELSNRNEPMISLTLKVTPGRKISYLQQLFFRHPAQKFDCFALQ